jgi:hypothetical protein
MMAVWRQQPTTKTFLYPFVPSNSFLPSSQFENNLVCAAKGEKGNAILAEEYVATPSQEQNTGRKGTRKERRKTGGKQEGEIEGRQDGKKEEKGRR